MLNKDHLVKLLSATFGKTKVNKLTALNLEQQFNLRDLIDLTFNEDKTISFRAAWLMDNYLRKHPGQGVEHLEYLVSRIPLVNNESCKRHYARIMYHLTMHKAPANVKVVLDKLDLEPMVEQFFDWIIDPKVKVAVKVFAADTLNQVSHRYDWILEELACQVKFMMKTGSPAIQGRGKKLLDGLQL